MRLTVIGCSGSIPGPDSAASCYLVRSGDFNLVLDLGNGALGPLQRQVALTDVDAVVVSHLHPDHCLDLCGLYVGLRYGPGAARAHPIPVLGPSGIAGRLGRAYDAGEVEPADLSALLRFGELSDRQRLVLGPFTITPFLVNHPVEAYGLRLEADGAVLAFTGDTDTCDALDPLLTGATLALTDAAFSEGSDVDRDIHLSARRAAEAAVRAGGVRRLMLTHLPPWVDREQCRAQAADVWPGAVELATPGMTWDL